MWAYRLLGVSAIATKWRNRIAASRRKPITPQPNPRVTSWPQVNLSNAAAEPFVTDISKKLRLPQIIKGSPEMTGASA